jgi:hypothetical protein
MVRLQYHYPISQAMPKVEPRSIPEPKPGWGDVQRGAEPSNSGQLISSGSGKTRTAAHPCQRRRLGLGPEKTWQKEMRLGKLRFVYYWYAVCYVTYMTMKPGWLLYSEDIYTSRQESIIGAFSLRIATMYSYDVCLSILCLLQPARRFVAFSPGWDREGGCLSVSVLANKIVHPCSLALSETMMAGCDCDGAACVTNRSLGGQDSKASWEAYWTRA